MPQQINLCSPLSQAPAQSFTARSMLRALLVVVLVATLLGAVLAWNMARSSASYERGLGEQATELQKLKAALDLARANAGPADAALQQQLQGWRGELVQRQALLQAVREGAVQSGYGHSDRLQLVAQSIPPQVWITALQADSQRLEMHGFTLEPAALNLWVKRLAQSPLMRGLELATVQVENATPGLAPGGAAPQESVAAATGRPAWSFVLVSAQRAGAPTAEAHP